MNQQPAPYLCHIFICTNVRENNPANPGCGAKGGSELKDKLKEAVAARGWKGKVRVSSCGCMGLCGTEPNVVLYPQGIHFSGVTGDDLPAIMDAIDQALPENKKVWFLIRGGNYRPCCWQGWAVLLIFIALIVAMREWVNPKHYMLYSLLAATGLIGLCIAKSGRHR